MSWIETEFDLTDPETVSLVDDLPLWSAPFGLKLLEIVRLKKGMRVLDIGSGTGFPVVELADRLGDSSLVAAIDPWRPGLNRIQNKTKVWGIRNLSVLEAKGELLPLKTGSFDLVVSNNGLNNVDDDKTVLKEIRRVTGKNAELVLTVNLPDTMIEFYEVYRSVLSELGLKDEIEHLVDHIDEKRKPLVYTCALVEDGGFRIKNIHEDYFLMRYTDGTSFLNHFAIRLGFRGAWEQIVSVADRERVFSELENQLNRIAAVHHEFRLTIPWVCIECERI